MRIISGKYARRNLFTLKSNLTRPTSDKVKESLFNAMGQFFNGGRVLDLYAGSGALGLEAVSRGYDSAVFVDINYAAVSYTHLTLPTIHVECRSRWSPYH